jgi:hypothetical protein
VGVWEEGGAGKIFLVGDDLKCDSIKPEGGSSPRDRIRREGKGVQGAIVSLEISELEKQWDVAG